MEGRSRCFTAALKNPLPQSFYLKDDTIAIAKSLLGKVLLVRGEDGIWAGGWITEVEAYNGAQDKACHAYGYKRTQRNQAMFKRGGCAYVYLCYGMYYMLNVVTNEVDEPHAILIRAIEPCWGIEAMMQRRKQKKVSPQLTAGPGRVTQALGITKQHNEAPLWGPDIVISAKGALKVEEVVTTPRIGVHYAKEDALLPYRFYIKNNAFVSKPLYPKY